MEFIYGILLMICLAFVINRWNANTFSQRDEEVRATAFSAFILGKTTGGSSKAKDEIRHLLQSCSKMNEQDWMQLKEWMNLHENNFVVRLYCDYPMLTESDIHLIILIRIGLTHQEIASSCNVLLSSLRTRRSRLKKKMGIECDSFSDFIKNIYSDR